LANVKPFGAVRPAVQYAPQIAALPYDVYNSSEARAVVEAQPESFLKIDRAETQFPEGTSPYEEAVYEKASSTLQEMIKEGKFIRDDKPCYYIYELTMDGRRQSGIVGLASVDDYVNGVIKKHENTLEKKEEDRIHHVDTCSAQTGPIFLAYRDSNLIDLVVERNKREQPVYDFTSDDGITHRVWVIADEMDLAMISNAFDGIRKIYIADGHHRAASAVKVSLKRREAHPDYTGEEEFNYFLSVFFPHNQLRIFDYNRVIKDFGSLTKEQFLEKIGEVFEMEKSETVAKPETKGEIGMYIKDDGWYRLKIRKEDRGSDPVSAMDVSVLQNLVLTPILGITDPKKDARIDFVGGIRGMEELERRVFEDCVAAFAMYPTSIQELFAVADKNMLMPPKSTWFEPKLRSGLFIHEIEK
jgi:uncharacterized protein (DUF1015 family)